MSIGKLQEKKNSEKLKQTNPKLYEQIVNIAKANWFIDLKNLRDEEAVHGAICGKSWQVTIGGSKPTTKLGMKNIQDFKTWCPDILQETNRFLESCYQQM